MQFNYWDYIIPSMIPLLVLIFLLLFAILICRKMIFKGCMKALSVIPIFVWFALSILGIVFLGDGLSYPLSVLLDSSSQQFACVGQVSKIQDADGIPYYYGKSNHKIAPAQFITVNDEVFYTIPTEAKESDWIKLTWISEKKVVLSYEILNNHDAPYSPIYSMPIDSGNSHAQANRGAALGKVIRSISVALFLMVLVLQYPLGKRVAVFLQRIDRTVTHAIVPNRYGLIHSGIIATVAFGILIGLGLTGFSGAYVLAALLGSVWGGIILKKQTTILEFYEDKLLLRELKKTKEFNVDEISDVSWGKSAIPYNRCLCIYFRSGCTLSFEQEQYLGLEHAYYKLTSKKPSVNQKRES